MQPKQSILPDPGFSVEKEEKVDSIRRNRAGAWGANARWVWRVSTEQGTPWGHA